MNFSNQPSGDREGCTWNDGVVTTPTGFKEAYQKYIELGFPSLLLKSNMAVKVTCFFRNVISKWSVLQTGHGVCTQVFLMVQFVL
jgi:hypothetical protein